MMKTILKHTILLSLAASSQAQYVIDRFQSSGSNALGNWHGCDTGMTCTWGSNGLTIQSSNVDYNFYTQLNGACQDMTSFDSRYLHIKLSGSKDFSISMRQNNPSCDSTKAPFPDTWDNVYAADYVNSAGTDIYVPMSHFNINKYRTVGFVFRAFRCPTCSTTISLMELVTSLPSGVSTPSKKPTGILALHCTRPNSIAFGVDDGASRLVGAWRKIIKDSGIKITIFAVGSALNANSGNMTNIYREMLAEGHQVALHSHTHPKLERLTRSEIENEIRNNVNALKNTLGITTKYFRAPYGTDGALTRQSVESVLGGNSKTIKWDIDIEDWIWGQSSTPEKQVEAVQKGLAKGGNLFVAHYLYDSTIEYFPEFIRLAKETGKRIMRVDQCLEDPDAPPLDD